MPEYDIIYTYIYAKLNTKCKATVIRTMILCGGEK